MSDPAIFDAHCMALGRLCVAWATIDRQLNDLLGAMVGCSPAATASITSTADTVGARCDIMRRLVHEDPINEEWAELFMKLLGAVVDLAKRRNRFTHDYWSFSEGTLTRMDRRATAKRSQSRQPIKLEYDIEHVTPADAVDRLTEEVGRMAFMLHVAIRDVGDWRGPHRFRTSPPLLNRVYALPDVPDVLKRIRDIKKEE